MRRLDPGGPFVLPPQLCTARRRGWLERGNRILATYVSLIAYASEGHKSMTFAAKAKGINLDTPMRIKIDGRVFQSTYRILLGAFSRSAGQLTNQVFILVYGNLEAYITDVLADALSADGAVDGFQDAVSIMTGTRWEGKFNRISQRCGVPLGKTDIAARYRGMDFEFFGIKSTDPITFLQAMADLRHRIVHSAGRADAKFLDMYPQSQIREGDLIQVPAESPIDLHVFFVPLTEAIDHAFADKYKWQRVLEAPEKLVDPDLRTL
jgi:hypothetical protein